MIEHRSMAKICCPIGRIVPTCSLRPSAQQCISSAFRLPPSACKVGTLPPSHADNPAAPMMHPGQSGKALDYTSLIRLSFRNESL